jgi:hypothetical protein
MSLATAAKMAWQMVRRHRLRTGLSMLGILIGNAAVVAIAGFGYAAQEMAVDQFRSLGTNLLIVFSANLGLAMPATSAPSPWRMYGLLRRKCLPCQQPSPAWAPMCALCEVEWIAAMRPPALGRSICRC